MLPSTQDYKIALMIGADSFRTLENVEVVMNPNYPTEPWFSTGGLAIVFKILVNGKAHALKCFYKDAPERRERLELIASYVKENPSDYFVCFDYLENELWVDVNGEGQGYSVLLMEWIAGDTLDNYLEKNCGNYATHNLQTLYYNFCNLAWWIHQEPFAHGDLKHDNIIVNEEGKLRLIDYDGMYVPALSGRKATELGSPCYQHPLRKSQAFNANLDDFSLLVLQITLLSLLQKPSLFTEYFNGDGILFKDVDYHDLGAAAIKKALWQLRHPTLALLVGQLENALEQENPDINLLTLLQSQEWINWLVAGSKNDALIYQQRKLKKFILGERNWMIFFVMKLSEKYELTDYLLKKYEHKWDWEGISGNPCLPWSETLIEKFDDKWCWMYVGRLFSTWDSNPAFPWSETLIEKFDDKWWWEDLSRNSYLPWSEKLIEKYTDKWDWKGLSENPSLPWSESLLKKYEDEWDWTTLSRNPSLPWSEKLLEKYIDRYYWVFLSGNPSLPWSEKLVEKYDDKWYYKWDWERLSSNSSLPWSETLIEKYTDKLYWGDLSRNSSLPWSEKLLEKYTDKWDWKGLSENPSLPWSEILLEKYEDKWDWTTLSRNFPLRLSETLLEKYKDKLDWRLLSEDSSLPWSEMFFEKNKHLWSWDYRLIYNRSLPWSVSFIKKYFDNWEPGSLYYGRYVPWTIDLLKEIYVKWSIKIEPRGVGSIYEKVFEPYLTDEFIDEVMQEIVKDKELEI